MLSFLIFFFLTFSVQSHADIVGGDEVSEKDSVSHFVSALFSPSPNGRGGSLCTASLLSENIALTAAHCVEQGVRSVLLFGQDVHSAETIQRPVTAAKIHARWPTHRGQGMDQGDIAVVKFSGGLPQGYQKRRLS